MAAGVVFDSVSKRFDRVYAVRDLSLTCEEGEFLVLVGPSGCGKTTALRMVAGLEEPSSGEISIGGTVVNAVAPRDRDVAMVFQSYALYPHMNVYDNLAFGLKQRRTPKAEVRRRIEEAAEMLGLQDLLHRRPRELSGGQRQRVALGRAIVRRPQVFLMDEPLSNLDAHLRLRTRAELVGLHRRLQGTVIYVTHDQIEAMTMGTRIAVMKDGVLQQVDTPQRLYDFPANGFVATFIGSPAMNLLDGELQANGGRLEFVSRDLSIAFALTGPAARGAVRLGVRPEHLHLASGSAVEETIGGEVTLVEPVGSDIFVTVQAATTSVVARLAPTNIVRPGQTLRLAVDAAAVHLFDAATQARLDARAAQQHCGIPEAEREAGPRVGASH